MLTLSDLSWTGTRWEIRTADGFVGLDELLGNAVHAAEGCCRRVYENQYVDVNLYPEMNETIKNILRLSDEPMQRYILARLEQLEAERDAAVERTKALCYLEFCGQCQSDGRPCDGCVSKWRGRGRGLGMEDDGNDD